MLLAVGLAGSGLAVATGAPAAAEDADVAAPTQPTNARWVSDAGGLTESTSTGDSTIRGSWNASTDAGSGLRDYRVQLSTSADFGSVLVDRYTESTTTVISFSAGDGVVDGGQYYFRVLGRDLAGNESDWSSSSNRVTVRQRSDGPVIAHAPIVTAPYGQAIPITATSSCAVSSSCTAALYHRATPADPTSGALTQGVGFTRVDLTPVRTTVLNDRRAVEWHGEIPASVVSQPTGVDYYLEAEDAGAFVWFPGTPHAGSQPVTVESERTGWIHVHTLTPPIPSHVPTLYGHSGEAIPVTLRANCSTPTCEATMWYRSTDGPIGEEAVVDSDTGELLAEPDWASVAMSPIGSPQPAGEIGRLIEFSAEIPADVVDTRGVDYVFRVDDEHGSAWAPGTTYEPYFAPTDGIRTGYYHVHVLEPPRVEHVPVLTSRYRQPIAVTASSTCAANVSCSATLYYRTTTSDVLDYEAPFETSPMTVSVVGTVDGVNLIEVSGTVPASVADTRGVDYFFSVEDPSTRAWWPGTSHVDGYVPIPGERVAYHHVRVLEPPHLSHTPPGATPALTPLEIRSDLTCSTEACQVDLHYTSDPAAVPAQFTHIAMHRAASQDLGQGQRLETWSAVVPGPDVTTRGLAYYITATDGFTNTATPGTFYWGAYVPTDGAPIGGSNTPVIPGVLDAGVSIGGANASTTGSAESPVVSYPVRVLEPPHILHTPAVATSYGRPLDIQATANCATGACTATLTYRTTGRMWRTAAMQASAATSPVGGQTLVTYTASIPSANVTPEGVDYRIAVDDGYVVATTPSIHVNVPNVRVAARVDVAADTWISTTQCVPVAANGCPPAHGSDAQLSTSVYQVGLTQHHDETFMRFDLSAIPPAHTVVAANLRLEGSGDAGALTSVRLVQGPWDEATLAWPTRPALSTSDAAIATILPGPTVVDVTSAVQSWVSSPSTNHGLALVPSTLLNHTTNVASREHGATASRPYLEITHVASDVQSPEVTLTTPVADGPVYGLQPLRAEAADDAGVAAVEFLADDEVIATDAVAPYEATWDVTALPEGREAEVWARAIDTAGNATSSAHVMVTIANELSAADRIEADVQTGAISIDDYTRYRFYAALSPHLLPERYHSATEPLPDPLEGVALGGRFWDQLQPSTRAELEAFVSPVEVPEPMASAPGAFSATSTTSSAATAEGYPARIPDDARTYDGVNEYEGCHNDPDPALDETVWLSSLGNETREYCVYRRPGLDRATIYWRPFIDGFDDNPDEPRRGVPKPVRAGTEVPDYVLDMSDSLEQAWNTYIGLGFRSPIADGAPPVKVVVGAIRQERYFVSIGPFERGPERNGFASPINDHALYIGATGGSEELAMHELFHRFQYEYRDGLTHLIGGVKGGADDVLSCIGAILEVSSCEAGQPNDPYLSNLGWMEATAEWAVHKAGGDVDEYADNLHRFLGAPERPLIELNPLGDENRAYGGFIVAEYLEELPGLANVVRESWEGLGGEGNRFASEEVGLVLEAHGTSYAEVIPDFWQAAYLLANPNTINLDPAYLAAHHVVFNDPHRVQWREQLGGLVDGEPKNTNGDGFDPDNPAPPYPTSGLGAPRMARTVETVTHPGGEVSGEGLIFPGGAEVIEVRHPDRDGRRLKIHVDANRPIAIDVLSFRTYPNGLCGRFSVPVSSNDAGTIEIVLPRFCDMSSVVISSPEPTRSLDDILVYDWDAEYFDFGDTIDFNGLQIGMNGEGGLVYDAIGLQGEDANGVAREGLYGPPLPGEGWGVADAETEMTAFFSRNEGRFNLNDIEFTKPPSPYDDLMSSTATVGDLALVRSGSFSIRAPETFTDNSGRTFGVAQVAGRPRLEVTHTLVPTSRDGVYEMVVLIKNTGQREVDLRYRRTLDWHVATTGGNEYVTIGGEAVDGNPVRVSAHSSSPDPLASPNPLSSGYGENLGPGDRGTTFDFDFGMLERGESYRFSLFSGALPSEAAARGAISALDMSAWALAKPGTPDGASEGTPMTFFFGYQD